MRLHVVIGTTLAVLVWTQTAWADVAPPRPEDLDCPRGSKGSVNQGGAAWCEPTTCANDLGCGEGYRCSELDIGLCVEEISVATRRVRPTLGEPAPEVPMQTVRSVRRRGCEPNGTCLNVDSTCEQARRCVPDDSPQPFVPSAPLPTMEPAVEPPALAEPPAAPAAAGSDAELGCACRTSGAGPSGASSAWGLLLVSLVLGLRGKKA